MRFEIDSQLRLYLEYVRNSFLQANTNDKLVRLGSREEILADSINNLIKILNGEDMALFPELVWQEGGTK